MTARPQTSRGTAHFERLYAANPDPWNFAASNYERRKYDATIAALGNRRFTSAFEAGCSIGILTHRLAANCGMLLAADIIPAALAQAQQRCHDLPQVSFAARHIPNQWPAQKFDLIVLSEILYFLTPADIRLTASHALASLLPGGTVLLVNYTEPTGDPCDGNQAAEIFIAATHPALRLVSQRREDKFRIDLLQAR